MGKRPAWIIRLRAFKRYSERKFGMSLGDLVNITILLLTIFSLALAVWGIRIAWIAYEDAKNGGKEQEETLRSAAESLTQARTSLAEESRRLSRISSQLDESINEQQRQQQLLNKSLDVSSKQLDNLERQTAIASRSPNVKMKLDCGSSSSEIFVPSYKLIMGPRVFTINGSNKPFKYRFTEHPEPPLKTDDVGSVECHVSLSNSGQAVLTGSYVRVNVMAWGRVPTNVQTISEITGVNRSPRGSPISYQIHDPDDSPVVGDDDKFYTASMDKFIDLVHGKIVYPAQRDRDPFVRSTLTLFIPEDLVSVFVLVQFGGDQQAKDEYRERFRIDHSEQEKLERQLKKLIDSGKIDPKTLLPLQAKPQ
jgi:hypothetical protein